MGWTPRDVDACSLWEFAAAVDGWRRCHGADEPGARRMSVERYDEILAREAERELARG